MGWGHAGRFNGREIGYMVEAPCDEDGCDERIDRGLGCVCGSMHGGEEGCGGYFCGKHLFLGAGAQKCRRCMDEAVARIDAGTDCKHAVALTDYCERCEREELKGIAAYGMGREDARDD